MAKKFNLIRRPLDNDELEILRRLQKKTGGAITPIFLQIILENRYPPPSTEEVKKRIYQRSTRSVDVKTVAGNLNQALKRDQSATGDTPALRFHIVREKSGVRRIFMERKEEEGAPLLRFQLVPEPSEEEAQILRDCENGLLRQVDRTPAIEEIIRKYWKPVLKASYGGNSDGKPQ